MSKYVVLITTPNVAARLVCKADGTIEPPHFSTSACQDFHSAFLDFFSLANSVHLSRNRFERNLVRLPKCFRSQDGPFRRRSKPRARYRTSNRSNRMAKRKRTPLPLRSPRLKI